MLKRCWERIIEGSHRFDLWWNNFSFKKKFKGKGTVIKKPDAQKVWTSIYYGARGSCKTLHQSFETEKNLIYFKKLYAKYPKLHPAIIFTNSKLSAPLEKEYKEFIYYWDDPEDFRYCPRKNCWKGKKKHRLHGVLLIFDDVGNILPANNWNNTPMWMKKIFMQGRHFGIHVLANMQDPFSVDINFRRCIDVAYKFTKIMGNLDPDETKPEVKRIFGIYRRRKIDAETLWRYGDLPEQTIRMMLEQREEENEQLKKAGKEMKIVYDDSWKGSYHIFNRTGSFFFGWFKIASTSVYDTLQDVQEYEPKGFICKEIKCIEKSHVHPWDYPEIDPKELKREHSNYCDYVKKVYELV